MTNADVPAHSQAITHHYMMHYPEHPARTNDPHYKDFEALRAQLKANPNTWQCAIGAHRNDFSECDSAHPLELHHAHVEFALQNGIDLAWLEKDYSGISDPTMVGAWVESANNLIVLCQFHHRGTGGVHVASASDYEASHYVRGLIS